MSEYLQKIVYLSQEDYNTLAGGGTAHGETGLHEDWIYLTENGIGNTDLSEVISIVNGGTGLSSTTAHYAFIGPTSGVGAPSWRLLQAADLPDLNWSKITTGKPTTLSGYGITDAKIASGVITLGSNTITPVTSVNGHTGASVSVTASDLGLTSALKYVGVKSSLPTATDSTTYSTYNNGDVITVASKEYAYVKGTSAANSEWVELGDEGSYKLKQTAFTNNTGTADGTNTSTTFIYSFSQDENGTITDIKTRKLPTYNNYVHPTTSGNKHIPSGGSSGQILGWSADGTATWIDNISTDTHRIIKVNDTQILASNTTALNLKAGDNITINATANSGDITISATDTTYESKAAASGGTAVSLVTTGEKYTWNQKLSSHGPSYGKVTVSAQSDAVSALTKQTVATTPAASSANETLKFTTANKWIIATGTNSSTAGSDEIKIAHLVPSSITNNGPASAQTPNYGATFNIPVISIDEAGHITEISTSTVKIPASDNVDTKLRIYLSTTNIELPLVGLNSGNATAAYASHTSGTKDVYGAIPSTATNRATINPSTGKITVPGGIIGDLNGNADTVSHILNTTTKYYVSGTTLTESGDSNIIFDTGIYTTTVAGQLNATTYMINEKVTLQWNSTDSSLDFVFA